MSTSTSKPPPVILSSINDYNQVRKILLEKNIKYEAKVLNNKQLKLTVTTESAYRDLTKAINADKFEWHTYENKLTRPIKVIARGLHPSCVAADIVEELGIRGFNIIEACNLKKKVKNHEEKTIVSLPLFMLSFDSNEDKKKIYDIRHIQSMKVVIEAPRKSKAIPQCRNCQRYGHTAKFCYRMALCVKCAGNHSTKECEKPKAVAPKCSNCHEAHPANYRGCIVAKELQKRRNTTKPKEKVLNQKPMKIASRKVVQGISYANVLSQTNIQPDQKIQLNPPKRGIKNKNTPIKQKQLVAKEKDNIVWKTMEKVIEIIDKISERLDKLEKKGTDKYPQTPRSTFK